VVGRGNRQPGSEPPARVVKIEHFALACRQLYHEAVPQCLDSTALKIDLRGSRRALEPFLNNMHNQGYRFPETKVLHTDYEATMCMLAYKERLLMRSRIRGLTASLFPSLETLVLVWKPALWNHEGAARFCFANPSLKIKLAR
jgi:hypothetical protein